jgi:hypothetical protein
MLLMADFEADDANARTRQQAGSKPARLRARNTYRLGSKMSRGDRLHQHDALRSMLQPPSTALIGWDETGPLYEYLKANNESAFRKHIAATCRVTRERDVSYIYNQLHTFCVGMQPGDRVVIADGWQHYAIGELLDPPDSNYVCDPVRDPDAPHQRAIRLLWVTRKVSVHRCSSAQAPGRGGRRGSRLRSTC